MLVMELVWVLIGSNGSRGRNLDRNMGRSCKTKIKLEFNGFGFSEVQLSVFYKLIMVWELGLRQIPWVLAQVVTFTTPRSDFVFFVTLLDSVAANVK